MDLIADDLSLLVSSHSRASPHLLDGYPSASLYNPLETAQGQAITSG